MEIVKNPIYVFYNTTPRCAYAISLQTLFRTLPSLLTGIESKAQEYVANLEEVRTEVFTEVTSNIQNAQAKQKLHYDFKHA